MLKEMTVVSTPHMSNSDRGDTHRQIHKLAYPKTYDGPPIGPKELARLLGAESIDG